MDYDSDDNDNNDDKIKPKFKEYKVDYNELHQSMIGKNSITFLEKKQKKIVQEYLVKFAGNDNISIHQNIYEGNNISFVLLNLPEDQDGFMKFMRGDYLEKKRFGQISATGVNQKNSLYQSEYINSISSIERLIEDVRNVFYNSYYTAVKLQLSFHIIWEGPSV
jgi:hypothetical protein